MKTKGSEKSEMNRMFVLVLYREGYQVYCLEKKKDRRDERNEVSMLCEQNEQTK